MPASGHVMFDKNMTCSSCGPRGKKHYGHRLLTKLLDNNRAFLFTVDEISDTSCDFSSPWVYSTAPPPLRIIIQATLRLRLQVLHLLPHPSPAHTPPIPRWGAW